MFALVVLVASAAGGVVAFSAFADDPSEEAPPVAQTYDEIVAEHAQQTPDPDQVSPSGRLSFDFTVDWVRVDEDGKIIGGGGGLRTCEADALVDVRDGRVGTVVRSGSATEVATGESVRSDKGDGLWRVYRDDEGDLQVGFAPGSCTDLGVD